MGQPSRQNEAAELVNCKMIESFVDAQWTGDQCDVSEQIVLEIPLRVIVITTAV